MRVPQCQEERDARILHVLTEGFHTVAGKGVEFAPDDINGCTNEVLVGEQDRFLVDLLEEVGEFLPPAFVE